MTQRRKRKRAGATVLEKARGRSKGNASARGQSDVQIRTIEMDPLPANTPPQRHLPALRDSYTYLIWILPFLVLMRNTSPIYTSAGQIDPWVYYGYMKHLVPFKTVLFPSTYYGSRLSWILPGAFVHAILPPVPANHVLHLTVFFTAVYSSYWLLSETFGRRIAILSAISLAQYPYFWEAVGWDYVDGVGIAYYLLSMALLFAGARRQGKRYRWILVCSGMVYAGMVYSNIAWVVFSPAFLGLYLWLATNLSIKGILKRTGCFLLWFGLGWIAISVLLGAVNWILEGTFWFYAPSMRYALSTVGTKNPWMAPDYGWVRTGFWLMFPGLAFLAGLCTCVKMRWKFGRGDMRVFFSLNLVYSAAILILMEAMGRPALQLPYYASYLIPSSILVIGATLFESVPSFQESGFRGTIAAALGGLLFVWVVITVPPVATFVVQYVFSILLAGIGMAIAGILLSRRSAGLALGLAALTLFSVCSRTSALVGTPNAADSFRRISSGMEAVERARGHEPVRFWFNQKDPYSQEFHSLNACYLWGYTAINFQFPTLEKGGSVAEGTFLVVPSSNPDVTKEASAGLASQGSTTTWIGKQRIESGGEGYWVHFFRIEPGRQPIARAEL